MDLSNISYQEIVDYWVARESECGLAVDWSEAQERCWRCGYKSRLQKCHIVPKSLGGKNDPSNLVLLCGRCHREAPNIADSRFMWIWMRTTCVPFYDLYWTTRGVQEFEKMFGRTPFTSIEFDSFSKKNALELLREEIKKATIHFGEGRINPSTIASIFALIEERIAHHLPSTSPSCTESRYSIKAIGICGNVKSNKR